MIIPDIKWAAGFLEGEGYFTICRNGKYKAVRIGAVSVDEYNVRALETFFGGNVNGPYKRGAQHHQPIWAWHVGAKAEAKRICELLYPHMGPRRQTQIDAVLDHIENNPNLTRPTHCKKGHLLSSENSYVRKNGNRRCRTCVSAANRERHRNMMRARRQNEAA